MESHQTLKISKVLTWRLYMVLQICTIGWTFISKMYHIGSDLFKSKALKLIIFSLNLTIQNWMTVQLVIRLDQKQTQKIVFNSICIVFMFLIIRWFFLYPGRMYGLVLTQLAKLQKTRVLIFLLLQIGWSNDSIVSI